MTHTLRDALQAARINLMKSRAARSWSRRQRDAESSEHPICEGCGKRHAPGLAGLLQALAQVDDDNTPGPAPASKLN
jgi:hypothetical protein